MFERLRSRGSADADAFAEEALGFIGPLYATALRLTRNRPDAEDLVQDTFVKAFRSAHRFERGTNLKAWLYTILHNTWRNRRRDAARDPVEVDSERVGEAAALGTPGVKSPEEILLRSTLAPQLQAALDDLGEPFREAVWLRDVEELSYAEIANVLGVPIGTVMSRISRGRAWLFNRLSEQRRGPLEMAGGC